MAPVLVLFPVTLGFLTKTLRGGKDPIGATVAGCYLPGMNLVLLVIVFLLLFGGGGFYFGGPVVGGGGLGLVLLICLIVYLMGGFRAKT